MRMTNITFTSEAGVQYYVYVSAQDEDNDPTTDDNGTFELSFTCTPVVEGCTDPGACNYDESATADDGSCELFSCLCPDSTGNALQFNMFDSYGDGWDIANYVITDLNNDTVASGNLNDAFISVDADNIAGNDSGYDLLCLQDGCYIIIVEGGNCQVKFLGRCWTRWRSVGCWWSNRWYLPYSWRCSLWMYRFRCLQLR